MDINLRGQVSAAHIQNITSRVRSTALRLNNARFFPKRSILIDGSNIAFLIQDQYKNNSGASLDPIFALIEELEQTYGISRDKVMVFFDANINHKLKRNAAEIHRLTEGMRQGLFRTVPPGTHGDDSLIQIGKRLQQKFIVLSNDMFRNKWQWFQPHRIAVGLDTADKPFLAVETPQDLFKAYYGIERPPENEKRVVEEKEHA
jgi:hypothetical protein